MHSLLIEAVYTDEELIELDCPSQEAAIELDDEPDMDVP